jgi:hypothetical protein
MPQLLSALLMLVALHDASRLATTPRGPSAPGAPIAKPPADKPAPPPAPAMTCTLRTTEGPRGGRLEVEGSGFGQSPLIRIGGQVTRMIERTETRIAVQIPADSNGGPVTLRSGKREIACGTLTIIGKD